MGKYKSAEVAAKWWAEHLDGTAKQDNGTDNLLMAELMMLSALSNAVPKLVRDEFQRRLEENINEQLEDGALKVILRVDYYPDGILRTVAEDLEIDCSTGGPWPIKTYMVVTKDKVDLSFGYGQPAKRIFDSEGYSK